MEQAQLSFVYPRMVTRVPYGTVAWRVNEVTTAIVAVSRCSASDRFTRATGRAIAVGRLRTVYTPWTGLVPLATFEPALEKLLKARPASPAQADSAMRDFCNACSIPTRTYGRAAE